MYKLCLVRRFETPKGKNSISGQCAHEMVLQCDNLPHTLGFRTADLLNSNHVVLTYAYVSRKTEKG